MPRSLSRLTEARIKAAEARGKLNGLAGEGKPLPSRPEEAYLDTGTAVGHRIMAEAGAIPEEIRLKKALDAAREALRFAAPDQREAAQQVVTDLALRHAIAQEARRKFLK